jgi:hypothetical protein
MPMSITTKDTWNGFEKGETVTVAGLRGAFTFEGHTVTDSGHECCWVYGGSRNTWGRRGFRAVDPSRVRRAAK